MAQRFNPAPGWPSAPSGWLPPDGWRPDPAWPAAPPDWQLIVDDGVDGEAESVEYGVVEPSEGDRPKRPWYKKKRVLIPAGLIAFVWILGSLGGDPEDPVDASPTQAVVNTAAAESADAADKAAEEAAAAEAAEEEEEARAAAEAEEEASAAAEAAEKARAEEEARASEEAQAAAEAEAEAAERKDPSSYSEVDQRGWALVVKDPDAHAGERFLIYGHITQFDSATGPDSFLADTDGVLQAEWYDYEHNTLVTALEDPAILDDIVESDIVKMHVEIISSFSYETQIGGNTTVPMVAVNMIEAVGSSL